MQTNYDPYILGIQSLDNLPCVKWMNFDPLNINGHSIKDISDDIQRMVNTERNKWGFYLNKAALYLTTAIAVGLLIGVIVELGLAWAAVVSINYIIDHAALACIFGALRGIFYIKHRANIIETRTKVKLDTINKWGTERLLFKDWFGNIPKNAGELTKIVKRCNQLLINPEDGMQKETIKASLDKIKSLARIINGNLFKELPELSRDILLYD